MHTADARGCRSTRALATALVAALLGLAVAEGSRAQEIASGDAARTAPYQEGSRLVVVTRNGSVDLRVDGTRKDIAIRCLLRCGGATAEEAQQRLADTLLEAGPAEGGETTVTVVFPEPVRPEDGASLEIRVPGASGLQVRSSRGPVTVEGFRGDTQLRTSGGAITVREHVGALHLETSGGPIAVEEVVGAVTATTSEAAIQVTRVEGGLTLRTSGAPIEVELDRAQSGPVQATTSDDQIRLVVADTFQGTVELSSTGGTLHIVDPEYLSVWTKLGEGRARVQVGEGEEVSHLHTTGGDIEFRIQPVR